MTITHEGNSLSYADSDRIARKAIESRDCRTVLVNIGNARVASTAALAKLVVLRRELLKSGRDMRLVGLAEQPQQLRRICRLDTVLPTSD
jgi:anti-anti-sigma regulatory factor